MSRGEDRRPSGGARGDRSPRLPVHSVSRCILVGFPTRSSTHPVVSPAGQCHGHTCRHASLLGRRGETGGCRLVEERPSRCWHACPAAPRRLTGLHAGHGQASAASPPQEPSLPVTVTDGGKAITSDRACLRSGANREPASWRRPRAARPSNGAPQRARLPCLQARWHPRSPARAGDSLAHRSSDRAVGRTVPSARGHRAGS